MKKQEYKCPICKGTGVIESPNMPNDMQDKRSCANLLRNNGYSIRQIMKLMGYKSTRSVTFLLTNPIKHE